MDRFVVITGGPGSGKTTLIEALASAGFARTTEAGRAIIQDQLASGGDGLPWRNPRAFAELMFAREVQSFETARLQAGRVFFDRGVPDVAGYLRLVGVEIPERIDQAARRLRYRRQVFVAPPWPAIFENDAERKQTFDEAIRTHDVLVDTYRAYEYELIVLPLVPVAERVAFVLDSLT